MKNIAILGLGSNKGKKQKNLKKAINQIGRDISNIIRISSLYKTEPRYNRNQPYFYNMVVKVETHLPPFSLLRACKNIEQRMGRNNKKKLNRKRIIDIDILFYDDFILKSEELTIPHERLYERNFVLLPLNEIEPSFVDPATEKTIDTLIKECSDRSKVIPGRHFKLQELERV